MRYFVIAPDGQRYGPADMDTLNQWVQEGRLMPTTLLQPENGGATFAASLLQGLQFPLAPHPGGYQQPGGPQPFTGYQRPGAVYDDGSKELQSAWIGSIVGLVLSCGCGYGLVLALFGLVMGITARKKGQTIAIVPIIISVIALLVRVGLFFVGSSLFGRF